MPRPWEPGGSYEDWSGVRPSDLIFAVGTDDNAEEYIVITPANYFFDNDALYDQEIAAPFLDGIVAEETESIFSPVEGLSVRQATRRLALLGLIEEPDLLMTQQEAPDDDLDDDDDDDNDPPERQAPPPRQPPKPKGPPPPTLWSRLMDDDD